MEVTNIVKLKSFQYRLIQRGLVLNDKLFKWRLKDSSLCTFCEEHIETDLHLLIYCKHSKKFWLQVEEFMNLYSTDPINFDVDTVLWNRLVEKSRHVKNTICLIAKYHLFSQRCFNKHPNFELFKCNVYSYERIEKYYAAKRNRLNHFYKFWSKT